MLAPLKSLVLSLCKVPPEPAPPFGSPGSITVFRAAPAYYRYRLCLWALTQLALLLSVAASWFAAWAVEHDPKAPPFVATLTFLIALGVSIAWLVALPVGYAVQRLDYELRWYMMTDRSLRIREGILTVHEMTLTFANVQNVSIAQGPLQRWLGIADLQVQTAGGGASSQELGGSAMHMGVLRGVEGSEALREQVLELLRKSRDAGLGDPDDARRSATSVAELCRALREEARGLREAAERLR